MRDSLIVVCMIIGIVGGMLVGSWVDPLNHINELVKEKQENSGDHGILKLPTTTNQTNDIVTSKCPNGQVYSIMFEECEPIEIGSISYAYMLTQKVVEETSGQILKVDTGYSWYGGFDWDTPIEKKIAQYKKPNGKYTVTLTDGRNYKLDSLNEAMVGDKVKIVRYAYEITDCVPEKIKLPNGTIITENVRKILTEPREYGLRYSYTTDYELSCIKADEYKITEIINNNHEAELQKKPSVSRVTEN